MSSISSAVKEGRIWGRDKRAILIDQDAQLMHIYENGVEIRTIPCSTGEPTFSKFTPAWRGRVGDLQGTIFSFGTYADNAWFLFRGSGDFLIHGAPYIYVDGKKVYQELEALGRHPSSHGCIRIHPDDARWFTAWNPQGVPIIITPWRGGISK
ncbi:MAG: L,D-transpeptidase [Anaerolineae bacterium]